MTKELISLALTILTDIGIGLACLYASYKLSDIDDRLENIERSMNKPSPQVAALDTKLSNSIQADSVRFEQFVQVLNSQAQLSAGKKIKGSTIIYQINPPRK